MPDARTYVKVHDGFPDHPKVAAAGGDAAWLYICALAYCSRHLTDGRIPKSLIRRISDRKAPDKLACALVKVGLFEDCGDDYLIHDYLEHQRSAAEVLELTAKRKAAGKRGGKSKAKGQAKPLASASGLVGVGQPFASDTVEAKRPPETETETETEETDMSPDGDVSAEFEAFWQAYPRHRDNGKHGGGASKHKTRQLWDRRLKPDERAACLVAVKHYAADCGRPDGPFPCHATTWLNERRWEDWQQPAANVVSLREPEFDEHGVAKWVPAS